MPISLTGSCRNRSVLLLTPLLTLMLSLILVSAFPSRAVAHPEDMVPRGHIAYDLLGSLAAAGELPPYTLADFQRGDRLYTRYEMAALTLRLRREELPPRYRTALRLLQSEFAAELFILTGGERAPDLPRNGLSYTGFARARGLSDPPAGEVTVRASLVAPLGRDGFAALSAGNFRDEWNDGLLLGNRTGYPALETVYLRVNGRALDVSIGKLPVRWGPGFVGGQLFSDEAPTVPQIRIEKSFRFWGWLGRQMGPLYFSQFYGQFFEEETPGAPPSARGTRRHLGGRRVETIGTRTRWQFAFSEGFKATRLPDPLFSQIFPYFLYQNDWIDNREVTYFRLFPFLAQNPERDAAWINYAAAISGSYRPDARGTVLYADLLLDDVKSPEPISFDRPTPRKIGQQYGVYLPDLGGTGRYRLRLEYSSVDLGTYRTITPPGDWFYGSAPLGHPAGPNANIYFGRVEALLAPRLEVAIETLARRRYVTEPGVTEPEVDRYSLFASYSPTARWFAGLRLEHRRVSFPNRPASTDSRIEVSAGAGL